MHRIFRAILALSILVLTGCRAGGNHPAPVVTLALLGDVMLGRSVHPTAETFSYLEPSLTLADLALANLESPLTRSPVQTESAYALCAPPESVEVLAEAGFDLLSLANNHRLDCGEKGLSETETTLSAAGLGFIGPGPEPVYRSIDGIPLAFLAFDATAAFDVEAAAQAVRSARETGALVVVSVHWGMEYQSGTSARQKQIAGRLAEAGAALIWGHHPHVLQPAAWIHDGKTLVLYSLGNALFDQHGLDATRRSALVLVTLDPGGVREYRAVPFSIDVPDSRIVEAGEKDTQIIRQYFR